MFYSQAIKISLLISIAGHLLALGIPFNSSVVNEENPQHIIVCIKNPALMPKANPVRDNRRIKSAAFSNGAKKPEDKTSLKKHNCKQNIKTTQRTQNNNISKFTPVHGAKEKLLRYQDIIKQKIKEEIVYPLKAEKKKIQGVVSLNFDISADGKLADIRIAHPSSFHILNNSAVSAVKNAGPFPEIPKEIGKKMINMELSIVYQLTRISHRIR